MRAPQDRRCYYRVVYPDRGRPAIRVGDESGCIVDCSERGTRYVTDASPRVATGNGITAQIRFTDGSSIQVRGMVTRVDGNEVCVRIFTPGISLGLILSEQRRLRSLQRLLDATTPPVITNVTR